MCVSRTIPRILNDFPAELSPNHSRVKTWGKNIKMPCYIIHLGHNYLRRQHVLRKMYTHLHEKYAFTLTLSSLSKLMGSNKKNTKHHWWERWLAYIFNFLLLHTKSKAPNILCNRPSTRECCTPSNLSLAPISLTLNLIYLMHPSMYMLNNHIPLTPTILKLA